MTDKEYWKERNKRQRTRCTDHTKTHKKTFETPFGPYTTEYVDEQFTHPKALIKTNAAKQEKKRKPGFKAPHRSPER